jgi:hypothetical protein
MKFDLTVANWLAYVIDPLVSFVMEHTRTH